MLTVPAHAAEPARLPEVTVTATASARFAPTQVGRMPAGKLERIEILRGGSAEFGGAGTQRESERGDYSIDEFILSPHLSWRKGADVLTLWPSYYRDTGERATDMARDTGDCRADREDNGIRILRLRAEGELRQGWIARSPLSGAPRQARIRFTISQPTTWSLA